MALKMVKGSIDRMFDKNLQDLVRGIRNHKEDEVSPARWPGPGSGPGPSRRPSPTPAPTPALPLIPAPSPPPRPRSRLEPQLSVAWASARPLRLRASVYCPALGARLLLPEGGPEETSQPPPPPQRWISNLESVSGSPVQKGGPPAPPQALDSWLGDSPLRGSLPEGTPGGLNARPGHSLVPGPELGLASWARVPGKVGPRLLRGEGVGQRTS